MANNPRSKPWSQFPYDPALGDQSKQCLDWVVTQLNQLIGQANVPPSQSIQSFGANSVQPTTSQVATGGMRTGSVTTSITFTATPTTITFYWDGTNGSTPMTIYRDDGTVTGPTTAGSPLTVSGLTASTRYYFYFYWDESVSLVKPAILPGIGSGAPAIAYPNLNLNAAQQQILRGHIPLAPSLSSVGVTTPGTGSSNGSGGGGGGAGGGLACPISGAPVKLYGDPSWWKKTVVPCEEFVEIVTDTGRRGTFSMSHKMYQRQGLLAVAGWMEGDMALTEQGEEAVVEVNFKRLPGRTVDKYEAMYGHIYSAWGFISHNVKP